MFLANNGVFLGLVFADIFNMLKYLVFFEKLVSLLLTYVEKYLVS